MRWFFTFIIFIASVPLAMADDWDDLRAAIYYERDGEVVQILDRGVEVNLIGPDGWTPLMVAAEQGDVAMVEYLLRRGADPTIKTDHGQTAFEVTSSSQVKRLVRVPVADPIGRIRKTEANPWAVDLPVVSGQVRAGHNDPKIWSDARWNIEYNQMDELERTLDQEGLDVNAAGPDGWTLLMTAAWKDKPEFVSFLLARGADPAAKNAKGEKAVDLTTSAAIGSMLGDKKAIPIGPASKPDVTYCKNLGGEAYLLCDRGDSTCRMRALNKQQQCEATGVWP